MVDVLAHKKPPKANTLSGFRSKTKQTIYFASNEKSRETIMFSENFSFTKLGISMA
jgi:hypothetical protein